jgi:hypothetical protein
MEAYSLCFRYERSASAFSVASTVRQQNDAGARFRSYSLLVRALVQPITLGATKFKESQPGLLPLNASYSFSPREEDKWFC